MMQLDTDNERAVLITALRRLVDFDPRSLSPQTQALKAILERLEPQKSKPIPRYCGHRLNLPRRGVRALRSPGGLSIITGPLEVGHCTCYRVRFIV
jgi:hypothetical protein